jgi:membrane-associated phospholipid phosphatase
LNTNFRTKMNIFEKAAFLYLQMPNRSKDIRYYLFALLLSLNLSSTGSFGQSRLQQFDEQTLINISRERTPEKTSLMLFLSKTHQYGEIGVPVGLFIGGVASGDLKMRQNALYVASSTAVTAGLTLLIKQLGKRRRPYIKNINIVPVYIASGSSFPSGHTSATMSTATALSRAYPKWYVIAPSFLWAGSVGYSRMYLGVHYPSDVAAGAVLGAGTALLLPRP